MRPSEIEGALAILGTPGRIPNTPWHWRTAIAEVTLAAGTITGVATVIRDLDFELTRMPGARSRLDLFEKKRGY